MRRSLGLGMMLAVLLGVAIGPALAWNCPVQIKAVEDAIKRSEAMKLAPVAKAKIDHVHAMCKAKAALAQAEAAASISTP